MTLFETFIKYIRYELNLSTHTVLSYSSDLSQFVTFLSGGDCTATLAHNSIDARRITTGDVRAWMASLSAAGLSLRSVHRKLQALRAFFKYAMKTGVRRILVIASSSPRRRCRCRSMSAPMLWTKC